MIYKHKRKIKDRIIWYLVKRKLLGFKAEFELFFLFAFVHFSLGVWKKQKQNHQRKRKRQKPQRAGRAISFFNNSSSSTRCCITFVFFCSCLFFWIILLIFLGMTLSIEDLYTVSDLDGGFGGWVPLCWCVWSCWSWNDFNFSATKTKGMSYQPIIKQQRESLWYVLINQYWSITNIKIISSDF